MPARKLYVDPDRLVDHYLSPEERDQLLGYGDDGDERDGKPAWKVSAEAAIERASTEVDSRLGARYATPLDGPPPEIEEATAALARRRLYLHEPPEHIAEEAKRWRKYLDEAGAGHRAIAGLPMQTTPQPSARSADGLRGRRDRQFSRETLEGY